MFIAGLVQAFVKLEVAALLRLLHGPASEDLGYFSHISLGVAAINAKRLQLHQLARIVFVESALLLLLVLLLIVLRARVVTKGTAEESAILAALLSVAVET